MVNGYLPETLAEALQIRAAKPVTPYAGGTDLMIGEPRTGEYLFLNRIPELKAITLEGETLRTLAQRYVQAMAVIDRLSTFMDGQALRTLAGFGPGDGLHLSLDNAEQAESSAQALQQAMLLAGSTAKVTVKPACCKLATAGLPNKNAVFSSATTSTFFSTGKAAAQLPSWDRPATCTRIS